MEQRRDESFTLAEIADALGGIDVDARETVLGALQQRAQIRQAEATKDDFTATVFRFAATLERAAGDNCSTSSIESWYEDLSEEAEATLRLFAGRESLTGTEVLVRDTAALSYLYLNLERGDEWDDDVLTNAGVDLDEMFDRFKNGIIDVHAADGDDVRAVAEARFSKLDDLSYSLDPRYWTEIVRPSGIAMRAQLKATGYALPELDEHGKYGENDDFTVVL